MWRRPMRTSSPHNGLAAGTPSTTSQQPPGSRDLGICRRAWHSLTSTNLLVKAKKILRKLSLHQKTTANEKATGQPSGCESFLTTAVNEHNLCLMVLNIKPSPADFLP